MKFKLEYRKCSNKSPGVPGQKKCVNKKNKKENRDSNPALQLEGTQLNKLGHLGYSKADGTYIE